VLSVKHYTKVSKSNAVTDEYLELITPLGIPGLSPAGKIIQPAIKPYCECRKGAQNS
jgi:hypothetical protein